MRIPLPASLSADLHVRACKRGSMLRNADVIGTVCRCPKISNRLPPISTKRGMRPPMSANGIWRPTVSRTSGCTVKKQRFRRICRANTRIGGARRIYWSLLPTATTDIFSTATATALTSRVTARTVSTILHWNIWSKKRPISRFSCSFRILSRTIKMTVSGMRGRRKPYRNSRTIPYLKTFRFYPEITKRCIPIIWRPSTV